jgi:hypothetical protein
MNAFALVDFCCVDVHLCAHIHEYKCPYMRNIWNSRLQLIMTVDAGISLGNHHLLSIFSLYSYLLLSLLW